MEYEKRENMGGFLKKKKGSGFFRIFGNTNLRWFELDYKSKIFGYKVSKSSNKFKKSIPFEDLTSFTDQIDKEDRNFSDWRFGFQVYTKKKKLILYTQSENEYNNWIYAFKIVFKKVPEAFPRIKDSVFIKAIQIFETPYLEAIHKKKMQEEQERKRKEQIRLQKLKLEEEERIRKMLEEEERLRQKAEEELKHKKDQEDKLRIKIEEENMRKLKEEQEKDKKRLYNIQHESIISELDENILTYENNKKEDELNNSFNLNKSINRSFASINYKDDIDDWNFYDENNEKIGEDELENFNPLSELKEKSQEKKEKENDIKNFLKNSLHVDSPFTINIESTVTNKISDVKSLRSQKPEVTSLKDVQESTASTKSKMESHESKSSIAQQSSTVVNNIPIIYSISEEVNNSTNITSDLQGNQNIVQSIYNEEKIHLIPSSEKTKEFSKKPKFFKRKSDVESSNETQNSSLLNKQRNNSKLHVDRDMGKSLIKNIEFSNHSKQHSKIDIFQQETSLKLVFNKEEKVHNNYTTNIATGKDHILSLEDEENWFEMKNMKRNNSSNNLPVIEGLDKKFHFEFNKIDDSINEKIDKRNYSFNYNDASDNDLSFSGVSNTSFNNTNIPPVILESEISFDKGESKNFAIQEEKIKELFKRKEIDDDEQNNNEYEVESSMGNLKNPDFINNDPKENIRGFPNQINNKYQTDIELQNNRNNHFQKIFSVPARQKRVSQDFDLFKDLDKDDEFDQVLKKETITNKKLVVNNMKTQQLKEETPVEAEQNFKISHEDRKIDKKNLNLGINSEAKINNNILTKNGTNTLYLDILNSRNYNQNEASQNPHEFSFDLKQNQNHKTKSLKTPTPSTHANNIFDEDFDNW
jgi:hypothetical protein